MTRSQTAFRYLWRVNAILILVAAGAVTLGVGSLLVSELIGRAAMRRQVEAGPAVAGAQAGDRMSLDQAVVVAGTHVMRAQLRLNRSSGFGSNGYSEIRNILFIQPGEQAARWLLGDNQHVVSDSSDLLAAADGPRTKRTVATAALVKPAAGELDLDKGKLLLFDPAGHRVVEAADGVRRIQVASLTNGEITLLYERDRRLVLATFDAGSFAKRGEQEMGVPQLK